MTRGGFLVGYSPLRIKIGDFSEIPMRDFSATKITNPHPRDWGFFGDFLLGIFGDSQSPIPIPGISNRRGFFDLARNEKSPSAIPGIGIRDWEFPKNPIPKPPLLMTNHESQLFNSSDIRPFR